MQKNIKSIKLFTELILVAPYKINQITGEPIKDEILIQNLDPENLKGERIKVFGHKQIFLNPHYRSRNTPKLVRDWTNLIYQSINNPENYKINTKNEGVKRASELIDIETIDDATRELMKIEEGKKAVLKIAENEGFDKGKELGIELGMEKGMEKGMVVGMEKGIYETAKNAVISGFSNDIIKKITKLTDEQINKIRLQI